MVLATVCALALVMSRAASADGMSIGYYNGPNGNSGYSVSLGLGGGYYDRSRYYGHHDRYRNNGRHYRGYRNGGNRYRRP